MLVVASIFILASAIASYCNEASHETLHVSTGEKPVLNKKQCAVVKDGYYVVEITQFFNSPPPESVEIWPPVGIGFEYRPAGEVQRELNLVQAFSYQTTIPPFFNQDNTSPLRVARVTIACFVQSGYKTTYHCGLENKKGC